MKTLLERAEMVLRISLDQFVGGVCFGFREHSGQRHRRAALALAFIRGLHEDEDFNRLLGGDRGLSCFEKAPYFPAEFLISSLPAGLNDAFAAKGHCSEISLVSTNATIGADAPILPDAGNEVGVFALYASDGFTTCAHERVQRLDAVYAVKEHVRRAFLIRARSPGYRARDRAELFVFQKFLNARAEPNRRTGKAGDAVLLRQVVDDDGVSERTGDRLVDKQRLARLNHGDRFLQMNPAVH